MKANNCKQILREPNFNFKNYWVCGQIGSGKIKLRHSMTNCRAVQLVGISENKQIADIKIIFSHYDLSQKTFLRKLYLIFNLWPAAVFG